MDFAKLAQERYSLRKFSDKPIEKEKLDLILKAAQISPTACNNQPQRILVIESDEALEKVRKCTVNHFDAPMVILICYDSNESWVCPFNKENEGIVDASIVTTHMVLQAADLGIGTTWVGYFDRTLTSEIFDLPENIVPVALLPIGYPADDAKPNPLHDKKLPIEKTVFYNKF